MTKDINDEAPPSEPPGLRRTVAFALAVLGTGTVQRSTLRALLGRGETKLRGPVSRQRWHLGDRSGIGKNKTTVAFGQALQEFERQGWVERTPESVIVLDRRALLRFARSAEPAVTPGLLDAKAAIRAARDDLRQVRGSATRDELMQRHDEIERLLYLLAESTAAPGRARTFTTI